MPVTLQPTGFKYKNSNNQFQGAVALKGDDGYSPTIAITDITGGHRITITDADGDHSFNVMDGEGSVQDVQVNGTSVVTDGVANVPVGNNTLGVVQINSSGAQGVSINNNGIVRVVGVSANEAKQGVNEYKVIVASSQHSSAFYGLAKAAGADMRYISDVTVGVYPEAQKSAIHEMLNGAISVEGSTPTITALPGVRYVCGEVTTLDVTLPASGCIDVMFESGSNATALTITPPTGVTLKWANGFDPAALEANTTYEINICDGLGVACAWT